MQVAKQPETDSNSRKYPCTNCNFQQKPKQGNAEKQGDKQEDANEPEVCCQYTDCEVDSLRQTQQKRIPFF